MLSVKTILVSQTKQNWPLALFIGLHIVIIMFVFNGAFPDEEKTDGRSLYYFYAERMFEGNVPYEDFDLEYAPLALPIFLIPRLFVQSDLSYHIAFAVQILFWNILGLLTVFGLSKRLPFSASDNFLEKLICNPWGVLSVYTVILLGLGPLIIDKFDLIVAVMVLFALYAFIREWNTAAWLMIAVCTMIKIFPVIVIPLFAIYLYEKKQYRELVSGIGVFTVTVMIVILPFFVRCSEGFIDSFTYHSERELQIESTYASALLLGDEWDITSLDIIFDHGSFNADSEIADTLAKLSPILTIGILLIVYGLYFRKQRILNSTDMETQYQLLLNYSILTIIAFILVNKVFSPQYMFWLFPLIPLVTGKQRLIVIALFIITGPITRYIYPDHYFDLVQDKETGIIYLLALRNILLLSMACMLLKWNLPRTAKQTACLMSSAK